MFFSRGVQLGKCELATLNLCIMKCIWCQSHSVFIYVSGLNNKCTICNSRSVTTSISTYRRLDDAALIAHPAFVSSVSVALLLVCCTILGFIPRVGQNRSYTP